MLLSWKKKKLLQKMSRAFLIDMYNKTEPHPNSFQYPLLNYLVCEAFHAIRYLNVDIIAIKVQFERVEIIIGWVKNKQLSRDFWWYTSMLMFEQVMSSEPIMFWIAMIQRLIFINLFTVNFRIIKVRHIAETITCTEVAVSKV